MVLERTPKKQTKEKIMTAGWKLFLTQGYEETTISQILEASDTSRSAFYHHFNGKEDLLFTLAYSYDVDYDSWYEHCDPKLHAADKLIEFNKFVMTNLENSPYVDLFPALYGLQVSTTSTRHILNQDRHYYKIMRTIIKEGQDRKELAAAFSYATLTDIISNMQIGLTYSWCLQQKRFSLLDYSEKILTPFLESLRQTCEFSNG